MTSEEDALAKRSPVRRTHVYGDNIDTDRLFPGRYLFAASDDDIRAHALEDLDADFRTRVQDSDVIVGGWNFGCGSSREQAVACLPLVGVRHVIARGFSRIYFRNCINLGVAPLVCPGHDIRPGDEVRIDDDVIVNLTRREQYTYERLPDFLQAILDDGGLVPHLRRTAEVVA